MKKNILIYFGIIIGFLVLSYAFVPDVLDGKIVNQSDISGWRGMVQEASEWNLEHPDNKTAWSGSMFSGMPTDSFVTPVDGDLTQRVYTLLFTGKRPAVYLFISLVGAFLLLLAFGVNPLIAAGGAIAFTFCSYNFQIIQVGHNTKMQAIAFMPWALAALVFTYRSKKFPRMLLGSALFALAVSMQVKANHPQISYYLAIIVALFVITEFIYLLAKKEKLGRFFMASGLLLCLGLVGIGTNAIKLIPTWNYTKYSMRGGKPAEKEGENGTKGLDLDYATAWSYGWEELPNMMIPDFNGGSSTGELGTSSETYKLFKRMDGVNAREVCRSLPLYWGPQPFTAGPMYMGAITVFLFLLGLFCYRGRERWWLLACTVLAILLALGNHFMAFTKLAVAVLPLYNKFRTVSMALVILQVSLPLLGFLVLDRLVKEEIPASEFRKKGWIALALSAGFCLLAWLIPGIAGDFHGATDSQMNKLVADALAADRRTLLRHDAMVSFIYIVLSFALVWWACTAKEAAAGRSRRMIAGCAVGVLVLVNMFSVGKRYLNSGDFVTPRDFYSQFNKRPVDEAILQDTDPSYRVLDLTVNVFNDSHPSYWHKSIGGYSPAKLQIYQSYIEKRLSGDINALRRALQNVSTIAEAEEEAPYLESLAALNCRYIILGDDIPPMRYRHARGNAWFRDGGEGEISLVQYAPNELRYHYSSPEGGTAVFSEVYYPDGWRLTVADSGEVLPISLSDEVLRSAELPAGEHDLVMSYAPSSYVTGRKVSLSCSILIILLTLGAVATMLFSAKKEEA